MFCNPNPVTGPAESSLSRGRSRAGVAYFVAACAFALVTAPAAWATTATFVSIGNGTAVSGLRNGVPATNGFAGTLNIQIDGTPPSVPAYCVEITAPIAIGDVLPQSPPDYPMEVLFILNSAFPQANKIGAPLSDPNCEAAAVQCAIWSFTDNMICKQPNTASCNVASRAAAIVTAAKAAAPQFLEAVPHSLTLTPPVATNFLPADKQHTVRATSRDADGNPLGGLPITIDVVSGPGAPSSKSGSPASGKLKFTYSNAAGVAGKDLIRATVDYTIPTGQKFKAFGRQGIVLAGAPQPSRLTATAEKSWVTGPCGDGVVGPGEECDDGNAIDTDACTNGCQAARCGDGIVGPSEQCDDGNTNPNDTCRNDCRTNVCGDQVVNPTTEQCDDGNQVDTDGCTNQCKLPRCGDGIVQTGEQCDDGNQVNDDACNNSCGIARCGDGIVQAGEECDDGNTVPNDGCNNQCTTARCGDGVVGPGEQCDDGNTLPNDGCDNQCRIAYCGDGVVGPGEQCDDGNNLNGDGCSAQCTRQDICVNSIDDDQDGLIDCEDPDCDCLVVTPVCKHPCPARIVFQERRPDVLEFQVSFDPSQVFDPATTNVSVVVTNDDGLVFGATLLPGDLRRQGGRQWVFRDPDARKGQGTRGGLFLVKTVFRPEGNRGEWRINVKAYGDLAKATVPVMTIQVAVGSEAFQKTATWNRTRKGWDVDLQ